MFENCRDISQLARWRCPSVAAHPTAGTATQWPAQVIPWLKHIAATEGKTSLVILSLVWRKESFSEGSISRFMEYDAYSVVAGKAVGNRRPGFTCSCVYAGIGHLSNTPHICQVRRKLCLWRQLGAGEIFRGVGWGRLYPCPHLLFLHNLGSCRSELPVVWFSLPEELLFAFLTQKICWLQILSLFVLKWLLCLPLFLKDSFTRYRIFGWRTFLFQHHEYVIPTSSGFHSFWMMSVMYLVIIHFYIMCYLFLALLSFFSSLRLSVVWLWCIPGWLFFVLLPLGFFEILRFL